MEQIKHYILPENTNSLYQEEAASSIGLTRDVADKINELVDAYNELSKTDLQWKQTQEGIIRKGVVFMKDNLVNSLADLLQLYKDDVVKSLIDIYGVELNNLKVILTPQMFGAKGDGVHNDFQAIQKAVAALPEGGVLLFPTGTYLMTGNRVWITKDNVTFLGSGKILCDYGFGVAGNHFKALGIHMEGSAYSTECRAFLIDTLNFMHEHEIDGKFEDFTFKDCCFKNFFYSIACIGGEYNYNGGIESEQYSIRDVVIENCYSSTYTDKNAGHFQCIQVENIAYINNRTYGGQNASSYNAIQGNGFIRVIGNYDHNNSYASCEIENGSRKVVVANNTFNSKIWIDDSFDVVVNGNTTEGGISVTVGSDNGDAKNVIISNNVTKNIRCEQFGTYVGGVIQCVNIIGNTVNGTNTHGIWVHGNAVQKAKICNNFITGTNTNDISIQRNAQLVCFLQGNFGNDKILLIAGTGGLVYALDNYNMTASGNRDPLPVSHLERSFNGLKVADSTGAEWRINVNTSGEVITVKY